VGGAFTVPSVPGRYSGEGERFAPATRLADWRRHHPVGQPVRLYSRMLGPAGDRDQERPRPRSTAALWDYDVAQSSKRVIRWV
jgi:hypothetical protein